MKPDYQLKFREIARWDWTRFLAICAVALAVLTGCAKETVVPRWTSYEIRLSAVNSYDNAYTDINVWAEFSNDQDQILRRPGFWNGGREWVIRFAPPDQGHLWRYRTYCSDSSDTGLYGATGQFRSVPYNGQNSLLQHGLLKMSPAKRNVIQADGKPFLMIGDTPWALPFRATVAQANIYAEDRAAKGFNTALLMTIQPDMEANGPEGRDLPLGFARGFRDLAVGHINQLNPAYFQYLDSLVTVLLDHGIVPVYQPVFHGFGWKGQQVLGQVIEPDEYVRYCRYLLARYGSGPAMWLLGADSNGKDPGVKEAGEMMQAWDCYGQPTGIHYNPCDDYLADWAKGREHICFHENKSYQESDWLDFQWAQTGHDGKHLYHKVSRMYANQPTKATADGEPTYEGMGGGKQGLGWWQGEEAWMQLVSGGTMGVVYGAASLWQWKVTPDEEGWGDWCVQPMSWRQALELEGSRYVGLLSMAFTGYDMTDMEKLVDDPDKQNYVLKKGDRFFVAYLPNGEELDIPGVPEGLPVTWFNPRTGKQQTAGITSGDSIFTGPDQQPWVLLIGERATQ